MTQSVQSLSSEVFAANKSSKSRTMDSQLNEIYRKVKQKFKAYEEEKKSLLQENRQLQ